MAAAFALAARGWPILPTRGKVPRLYNGLHGASISTHAIRNWFELWPDTGIGVRTGDGLVVLDVDGDDGHESLRALERRHEPLPATVSAVTGNGEHLYFATRDQIRNTAGKLGRGLDVRGEGGYVIAPPTIHPDTGRPYEWDNHPDDTQVAPLPAWLLSMLSEAPGGPRKRIPAAEWVRMLRGIAEGERNDRLARLCGHLIARNLDERVTLELLLAVNQARCRPPLPEREVTAIVESILRRHLKGIAA